MPKQGHCKPKAQPCHMTMPVPLAGPCIVSPGALLPHLQGRDHLQQQGAEEQSELDGAQGADLHPHEN